MEGCGRTKVAPSMTVNTLAHRANIMLAYKHEIWSGMPGDERMEVVKLPPTRFIDKQWLPIGRNRHVGSRKNSM